MFPGSTMGFSLNNMGDLDTSATRPRTVGTLPTLQTGHSTRDFIGQVIGSGLNTLNLWLATRAGMPLQQQQYPIQQQQQPFGVTPGQQVSAGVGQGFSNFAAQFGVSPTTMGLLLAGGVYLLFRPSPRR